MMSRRKIESGSSFFEGGQIRIQSISTRHILQGPIPSEIAEKRGQNILQYNFLKQAYIQQNFGFKLKRIELEQSIQTHVFADKTTLTTLIQQYALYAQICLYKFGMEVFNIDFFSSSNNNQSEIKSGKKNSYLCKKNSYK